MELLKRAREEEKQTMLLEKKKQQQQRLEVIRKARERGEAKIRERRRQQKRRLELLEKENEKRLEILHKENEQIDWIEIEKKNELDGAAERNDIQDRLKPVKKKPSRLPLRRHSKPVAEHEDVKESTDASTGSHNETITDGYIPRGPVVDQVPNTNASTVLPSSNKKSKPKVNKTNEADNGLNNRRMSLPPRNSTIVDESQHYLVRPESVYACGSTIVENDEIQSENPQQMKAADGPQEADPIDPAPVSIDPPTENNDVAESFNNQNKFPSFIEKTKFSRQISNIAYVEDRYDIGKTLGDGNFAVVKYCVEKTSKKPFALKIIDKLKLKGREMMIENEIDILKVCKHPNIVRLFEEFETDSEIYTVLEYVKVSNIRR